MQFLLNKHNLPLNKIIKHFGEPKYLNKKEEYDMISYAGIKCSNPGLVGIWDTKNWYGKGYILVF
jgi:hypothetical protein